ncbi:sensor histidine kinase [Streptantibioticus silvisoli]|uniref:histidine kinase n=1 Tax=Streptantibioticus silvisoli TaxID=2705255 RepID=A0ABT6W2B7_9ACTN|nr:HAMP domain-containing sensor histidine kinase [Streptantibioticus silvisoli]MDI5964886.1 HAMP domain-containing sensor histidine kinase [Streptantibioticus silvisoli]
MKRPSLHRGWSLRSRLLVSSVTLIAVVCAIVGVVTTVSLQAYLYTRLDSSVDDVVGHVMHAPGGGPAAGRPGGFPGGGRTAFDPRKFVTQGGQTAGTLSVVFGPDGRAFQGAFSRDQATTGQFGSTPLTAAQLSALSGLPRDGDDHTVTVPGLGDYRMKYFVVPGAGTRLAVGLPTLPVSDTVDRVILVIICVTAAGLAAAGMAGAAMIRYALVPLRRVAVIAGRVSELPLSQGEVTLSERVPSADTDPRTEVGQVGSALNRLLGHVESALESRQASETRVRQFVADASHELRTPLASIRGYAELIRRGPEEQGPGTRHALGRIESEAGRMTTLVEDLLLLARLDAGRPLSYDTVDLSPLVIDTVSDARAAGPGHLWRVDLPDDPAQVRADTARLHQVLANLLANARTHTPPGTTVTARVLPGDGVVRLDVEDTGPGIPGDLLPHVFERFARGDASRARANGVAPGGSSGLGLAIAHAVVTAHGGTITADSAPGRTVFRLTLPATAEA